MNFFLYSLFISIISISLFANAEVAVDDWMTSPDSTFEYLLVNDPKKWGRAAKICAKKSAALITTTRAEALMFVLGDDKTYWIDALYNGGIFQTYDGATVDFIPDTVTNNGGRVLTMNPSTGSYARMKRNQNYAFICERDLVSETTMGPAEIEVSATCSINSEEPSDQQFTGGTEINCPSDQLLIGLTANNYLDFTMKCCDIPEGRTINYPIHEGSSDGTNYCDAPYPIDQIVFYNGVVYVRCPDYYEGFNVLARENCYKVHGGFGANVECNDAHHAVVGYCIKSVSPSIDCDVSDIAEDTSSSSVFLECCDYA